MCKTGRSKEFELCDVEVFDFLSVRSFPFVCVYVSVFIRFIIDRIVSTHSHFRNFIWFQALAYLNIRNNVVYVPIVYLFRQKENLFLKQPYLGALNYIAECFIKFYVPDFAFDCAVSSKRKTLNACHHQKGQLKYQQQQQKKKAHENQTKTDLCVESEMNSTKGLSNIEMAQRNLQRLILFV